MGFRTLAELSIAQSIEDLWDDRHMRDGFEFFSGGGFSLYATIAGIKPSAQSTLIDFVTAAALGAYCSEKQNRRKVHSAHKISQAPSIIPMKKNRLAKVAL